MPSTSHPTRLANGLVYINPEMPGLSRVKRGTAFKYRDPAGSWVKDVEEITRIRQLAIPPAYTGVWICPLPNGHLQATGLDARGRKQYRYHANWRLMKDETKFERLEAFGRALPRIRARVKRDMAPPARGATLLSRERVLATLVRLLDTTFLRVGNETYAVSNGSFGLTTLRNRHADIHGGAVTLSFRGKSGVMHEAEVDDPRIARIVRRCQQLPGQALFQYQSEDGSLHSISSTDVNDYLREAAGASARDETFSAKDFRTWHGTVQALELTRLACQPSAAEGATVAARHSAKDILMAVAKQLGNTPAVCKKAYVHPAVLELGAMLATDTEALQASLQKITGSATSSRGLGAAETRMLAFLKARQTEAARAKRTVSRSTKTA